MKSPPEASAGPITVLIADDHPLVREGLAGIFKSQNDIRVVAEATNGEEALELCNRHLPVVLLDLRMPKNGLQVMVELLALRVTKPRVIVMTTYENEEDIRRALQAGAKRVPRKRDSPQKIRDSVRTVAAGKSLAIALKGGPIDPAN